MKARKAPQVGMLGALGVASGVCVVFVLTSSWSGGQLLFPYLIWNLFLAWLPLLLALRLRDVLKRKLWSSWEGILLTAAWVALLPNSFYVVSDYIHLAELHGDRLLIGAVTFTAFVFTSLCLGFISLYLVHTELLKRTTGRNAAIVAGLLLFLSSLAIYVGRDLRWNSWDVILNPFGLLFDVSSRLIDPSQYSSIVAVILPFFTLLVTIYYVVWQFVAARKDQII